MDILGPTRQPWQPSPRPVLRSQAFHSAYPVAEHHKSAGCTSVGVPGVPDPARLAAATGGLATPGYVSNAAGGEVGLSVRSELLQGPGVDRNSDTGSAYGLGSEDGDLAVLAAGIARTPSLVLLVVLDSETIVVSLPRGGRADDSARLCFGVELRMELLDAIQSVSGLEAESPVASGLASALDLGDGISLASFRPKYRRRCR